MTTVQDIESLVEYVNKHFPDGCRGVYCVSCPLEEAGYGTIEYGLCEMLMRAANVM